MTRLIDADLLLVQMKRWYERLDEEAIMTGNRTICFTWNDAVTLIKHAPTVNAVPIEFIKSEIARMKEGANQHYPECVIYAEDLEVLISEWEGSKKRYAID